MNTKSLSKEAEEIVRLHRKVCAELGAYNPQEAAILTAAVWRKRK